MTPTFRNYQNPEDYSKVSAFLIEHYQPGNKDGNWLEPIWEYMNFHPALESEHLKRIGIWEQNAEIVAVTNIETDLGEAFFQFKPGYEFLRTEMLDYAEKQLADSEGYLNAYVNDIDPEFTKQVQSRGYQHEPRADRPMSRFAIPDPFPQISLPPGFKLLSLGDEPDWGKVHQVMHRGFNHGEVHEITNEDREMRRKMFATITADLNLKIVVKAPNGDFVSICGMFYPPSNQFCQVEPVATDPDYRRLGLGKVAVLEGIRRCVDRGAKEAFVGSDQLFYQAIGFDVIYTSQCWRKRVK